jgi:hypothetical protein
VGSDKVENQVYIYLDLKAANITSTIGPSGTNSGTTITSTPLSNGSNQATDGDGNKLHYTVLIGQAHSHPETTEPGKKTLSQMSPTDKQTSTSMQIPIYGMDAMNGSGQVGAAANINRQNPDGTQTQGVGKTKGSSSGTFNIGKDALKIWGRSKPHN